MARPRVALFLAAGFLSRAVPDRRRHQPWPKRDRHSALHAAAGLRRRTGSNPRRQSRQLCPAARRQPLYPRLSQLARLCGRRHPAVPAARLPHGLCHRAGAARLAQPAPHARHPAVLDELPHPRLCLDRHPQAQRADQQPSPRRGPRRPASAAAQQRLFRRACARLFVPAVHDPAALRDARAARPGAARGGDRSRLPAVSRLSRRHPAAVAAQHRRRLSPRLHSGGRRVRHPRSPRRSRHADDRQGAVGRVLHQSRLAGRFRGGDRHAGPARRADRAGAARARARRGGGMTARRAPLLLAVLALGYLFLYAPIVSLIVYSFNASRLVTVWAGFSTRWYGELLHNSQMLKAAWLSLRVGVMSATLAALALARAPRFVGRSTLVGLLAGPLVMPEVMLGLASLLLFVSLESTFG